MAMHWWFDDSYRDKRPWWLVDLADQCRQYEDGIETEQEASDRVLASQGLWAESPEDVLCDREEADTE